MDGKTAERKICGIIERLDDKLDQGEYPNFKDARRHIVNIQLKAKYSHSGPDWWEQADKFRTSKVS